MYLVTTDEMRQREQQAVDAGATWESLMERAGWGVAQAILQALGDPRERRVVVLVGPGNNGGDGLVVARHLHDAGAQVSLVIWKRSGFAQDANWQQCRQRAITEVHIAEDELEHPLESLLVQADVVVDALLGMGSNRPVAGALAHMVAVVNHARQQWQQHQRAPARHVVAVDVPTGINSDNGAVMGAAIQADITVATGLLKRGLFLYPARAYAGTLTVADIGILPEAMENVMSTTIDRAGVRSLLPPRPEDSHKGTFGKVLVVAGSFTYPGAAVLATAGAARVGAGLVTLAAPRSIVGMSGRLPEVTLLPLPEAEQGVPGSKAAEEVRKHLDTYRALLVGPGLGQEKPTRHFLRTLFGIPAPKEQKSVGFHPADAEAEHGGTARLRQRSKDSRVGFLVHSSEAETSEEHAAEETEKEVVIPPTVLDADALNILAEMEDWHNCLPREQVILTPHPGEMKRLLKVDELDADLVRVATDAAQQWGQVVVLKGATTVVAAPDGRNAVHAGGNPALATAGTGDVLAGAIAGLLAQGVALFDAAVLGVYLHAAAGVLVRQEVGDMGALASDLLPRLPRAIQALKDAKEEGFHANL